MYHMYTNQYQINQNKEKKNIIISLVLKLGWYN
jgi:hypothetical protein